MAQATYVQDGDVIDYTPVGALAAGDVVPLGGFIGITSSAIAAAALGALVVEGVFDFTKGASVDPASVAGVGLWYWDDTANAATLIEAGNTPIGYSIADATSAATTVRIRLGEFNTPQAVYTPLTANGAIPPHANGKYMITNAACTALTLAAPTATTDDGVTIEVRADTTTARTITATGLLGTGSANVNVATFAAFKGAGLVLRAYQGLWLVISQIGITFS